MCVPPPVPMIRFAPHSPHFNIPLKRYGLVSARAKRPRRRPSEGFWPKKFSRVCTRSHNSPDTIANSGRCVRIHSLSSRNLLRHHGEISCENFYYERSEERRVGKECP